jgi:O-acetyl-ADP-ribose deacetylase (regulator of RNase III)
MNVSIFVGDIADAPAEAICTSTNPRLSLMMGTGASVREKGGWDVMRACEAIVATGGGKLKASSVHATTPGAMQCKTLIHCVASDHSHMTSAGIIQACVKNALACARRTGCRSIAMPLFGTGHARFKFDQALIAMRDALRSTTASVEQVVIVVLDPARAADAERVIASRG